MREDMAHVHLPLLWVLHLYGELWLAVRKLASNGENGERGTPEQATYCTLCAARCVSMNWVCAACSSQGYVWLKFVCRVHAAWLLSTTKLAALQLASGSRPLCSLL